MVLFYKLQLSHSRLTHSKHHHHHHHQGRDKVDRIHSIKAKNKKRKTKQQKKWKATKNAKKRKRKRDGVKHKLYIINNYIYIYILQEKETHNSIYKQDEGF